MGCVITPQYQVWAKRFPTLAPYITELQFGACFDQAQLFQANDGSGPIDDPVEALRLMGLMIAHIAVLTYPTTGNPANPDPPSPLVGRISNATQGSVSVATQNDYPPGSPQWFQQTTWGSMWYQATAQFRTMHYRPGWRGQAYRGGLPFGFGPRFGPRF